MVDYGQAFATPFRDVKKLFAGTFILLGFIVLIYGLSFFLFFQGSIANLLNQEYQPPLINAIIYYVISFLLGAIPLAFFVRYGINAAMKKFIVPSWKDFSGLFKDGIKLLIVQLIYAIPFIAIIMVFSFYFLEKTLESTSWRILYFAIIILLILLLSYIIPVVLFRSLETKSFSGGFDFKAISKKLFSKTYFVAWMLMILILVGLVIAFVALIFVLGILAVISIAILSPLLIVAAPMGYYIIYLITMGILGQAYGEVKLK